MEKIKKWGELKKYVEKQGISDDTIINSIDIDTESNKEMKTWFDSDGEANISNEYYNR